MHIRLYIRCSRGRSALFHSQEARSRRYSHQFFIWSNAPALLTVCKWHRHSAPCFRNALLLRVRGFVSTSGIQKLRACAFCTTFCILKISIYDKLRILWITITKSRERHFPMNYLKSWRKIKRANFVILYQETNSCLIINIRLSQRELHPETRFRKKLNKQLRLKNTWFQSFDSWTESTVYLMYPKALHIIGHSYVIALCLI
jgi:hypothetical protein